MHSAMQVERRAQMEQMIGAEIPWGINGTARDDPYMDLASAVVAQAAKDYIKILRKLWKKDITVQARRGLFLGKLDLESFFHSAWYEMLKIGRASCRERV